MFLIFSSVRELLLFLLSLSFIFFGGALLRRRQMQKMTPSTVSLCQDPITDLFESMFQLLFMH